MDAKRKKGKDQDWCGSDVSLSLPNGTNYNNSNIRRDI